MRRFTLSLLDDLRNKAAQLAGTARRSMSRYSTFHTDDTERISNVSWDSPINRGHSVCVTCGKDTPRVWDVICAVCGNASCYACATARSEYWFCQTCIKDYPANLQKAKNNCRVRAAQRYLSSLYIC